MNLHASVKVNMKRREALSSFPKSPETNWLAKSFKRVFSPRSVFAFEICNRSMVPETVFLDFAQVQLMQLQHFNTLFIINYYKALGQFKTIVQ